MAMYYKPATTPAERENIMAGATESQLRRAIAKAECVDLYRREAAVREGKGPINEWAPRFVEWLQWRYPHLRVSRSTLYRWVQLYGSIMDLHRLVDTRGRDNRSPSAAQLAQSQPAPTAQADMPANSSELKDREEGLKVV